MYVAVCSVHSAISVVESKVRNAWLPTCLMRALTDERESAAACAEGRRNHRSHSRGASAVTVRVLGGEGGGGVATQQMDGGTVKALG